jgi:hypothetical protein
MVLRLMSRWWASRRISKAKLSRVQELSVCWCSSVRLLARLMTFKRSAGGKAPGTAGTGCVLKTCQAVGDEAFPPSADGVAIAAEVIGYLLISGLIGVGSAQDQSAAKDERLRRGAGPNQSIQRFTQIRFEHDRGSEWTWHRRHPCTGVSWGSTHRMTTIHDLV